MADQAAAKQAAPARSRGVQIETMRKLLQFFVLAAAITLAVSAPLEPLDQNDDDDGDESFEVFDLERIRKWNKEDTVTPDPCPARSMPCKAGQYLDPSCRCRKCPNGMTSPYSPSKPFPNVGINSCKSCKLPYRIFKCPRFLSKNCRSLRLCVKPGDRDFWTDVFETFRLPLFAVKMIPLMYPDVYMSPSFTFRKQIADPKAPELKVEDALDDVQDVVAACDIDSIGCCLPGTFGPNAKNCTDCPPGHSSAYSTPSDDCSCPNAFARSCKPCNLCEQLDASNQCISKCSLTSFSKCSLRDVTIKDSTGAKTRIEAGTCYN